MPFTDVASFPHYRTLAKQSYRVKFQRLSTKKQETVQNMENMMYRVRESEDKRTRSGCIAAGPRKQQSLERGEGYIVRDKIYLSLDGMAKATDIKGTSSLAETRYDRMLAEQLRKESLQFLAGYVRECGFVQGRHVCDKDTCT